MDPVILGPTEVVPGRPFTDVEMTERDLVMLRQMVVDLQGVLEEAEVPPAEIVPYQQMAWRVDDLAHRLMICNEERLRTHPGLHFVGFCAERKHVSDIFELEEANAAVVKEFPNNPGILSYSSVKRPDGDWANLVIHDEPEDRERWRAGEDHVRAVEELSPHHYVNIRIHNGHLTAPLFEAPEIVVSRTKYFEYGDNGQWRAERDLEAAAS